MGFMTIHLAGAAHGTRRRVEAKYPRLQWPSGETNGRVIYVNHPGDTMESAAYDMSTDKLRPRHRGEHEVARRMRGGSGVKKQELRVESFSVRTPSIVLGALW
jgi:hypothetical protein